MFLLVVCVCVCHSILLIMRIKVNNGLGSNSYKFGTSNLNIYSIFKLLATVLSVFLCALVLITDTGYFTQSWVFLRDYTTHVVLQTRKAAAWLTGNQPLSEAGYQHIAIMTLPWASWFYLFFVIVHDNVLGEKSPTTVNLVIMFGLHYQAKHIYN